MTTTPPFPQTITIRHLFGADEDVEIPLRLDERVTLLAGPNGSGKTHVLRIIRACLGFDLQALALLPFRSATIDFANSTRLEVERSESTDESQPVVLRFTGFDGAQEQVGNFETSAAGDLEESLPDYIRAIGPDLWEDIRDGEVLTFHELGPRFGIPAERLVAFRQTRLVTDEEPPQWLVRFRHAPAPTLIETGRLDVSRARVSASRVRRPHSPQKRRSQIELYIDSIEGEMNDARRQSLAVSQRKDREFAERALDKARAAVREAEIRKRYDDLAALHQELFNNGLTAEAMTVSFPGGRTNPTERRILDLFLDDWEAKLAPLRPVHDKVQLLRSIVDEKMNSKSIDFRRGHLTFLGRDGSPIPLDSLSSGEQHLVALFTMLLFSAADHSVVLIDEPEISMHAAWKHSFLDDIRRVAEIRDLQIVAATHSSAIINGEWELVEQLKQLG